MNNKQTNIWIITLPQYMLWVFILLNISAIILYPGSTYRNHLSNNYSFTQNFLSDMGRTMTFSGEHNFLSCQLFNMSLILSGFIFFMFYYHIYKIFKSKTKLSFLGSIFGIFGGFSLIGVGLTPANLYLDFHIICANWLFRFMFLASVFYTLVIYFHPKLNNKYAIGYFIFSISILVYIFISEFGPNPRESLFALSVQVISQKIILIIFIISVYIQTFGIKKLLK